MGFLQETKMMQGIYTRHGAGYDAWDTESESSHQAGVAVVWKASKGLQVEGTVIFGPNEVNFLLTLGARRWYVVGSYMLLNDVPDLHSM